MQPRTLKLIAMPVVGNAHSDRPVWDAAHEVVADESAPMADRVAAMAKMNELTGEDDPCDESAIADYLELAA